MPLPLINHVFRVATTPEVKQFQRGDGSIGHVLHIRAAASKSRRDPLTNTWETKAQLFIDVDYFGDDSTILAARLSVGNQLFVSGDLYSTEWKDKEGRAKSKTVVRANRIAPLVDLPNFNGLPAGSSNFPAPVPARNNASNPTNSEEAQSQFQSWQSGAQGTLSNGESEPPF